MDSLLRVKYKAIGILGLFVSINDGRRYSSGIPTNKIVFIRRDD